MNTVRKILPVCILAAVMAACGTGVRAPAH
jgi:hypothetical protein